MITRRAFNKGLLCSTVVAGTAPFSALTPALAASRSGLEEYRAIIANAQAIGLTTPRGSLGAAAIGNDPFIAYSDLLDLLESSSRNDGIEADHLIERAAELVRSVFANENAPSDGRKPATQRAALVARPRLKEIEGEYLQLFKTCKIQSKHRNSVAWYTKKLMDPQNQERYKRVAAATCVPWFAVGILHGMEAGFNFRGHLHNGDSLKRRTRNVPANRPPKWNPPSSWEESAIDALRHDKLDQQKDWSLATTLYRWEGYNGWRSRTLHNINTPYLWSYSQHYSKGKFVADNVWDSNAVSKQCGAGVMLRVLVDEGIVQVPSS